MRVQITDVMTRADRTLELTWAESKGVKATISLELVADIDDKGCVLMLMVVMRATRYLTSWHLLRSSDRFNLESRPALLDLLKR